MKTRPGNSENSKLNGEWAKHVRKWWKKFTSGKRRAIGKELIKKELKDKI